MNIIMKLTTREDNVYILKISKNYFINCNVLATFSSSFIPLNSEVLLTFTREKFPHHHSTSVIIIKIISLACTQLKCKNTKIDLVNHIIIK